jgi:hypothetical protein
MHRKRKFFRFIPPLYWALTGFAVVVFLTSFWLHPISGYLPLKRQLLIKSFTLLTPAERTAQAYWHLRERMGSGTLSYNQDLISTRQILEIKRRPLPGEYLTEYISSNVKGVDYLTTLEQAEAYLQDYAIKDVTVFASPHALITKTMNDGYSMVFIFSLKDLYKTHGLFDFTSEERDLLTGMVWLSHTRFN